MMETPAKSETSCRLLDVLTDQRHWSLKGRLLLFRRLVLQAQSLHEDGRTHREIGVETVAVDEKLQPLLDAAAGSAYFGGRDSDPEFCPPELAGENSIELPENIEAAAAVLQKSGCTLDPRQIDVYQLGTLLCRLLTDESILAYMYSSTVMATVPAFMRPLLGRALGHSDASQFQDCRQLLEALDEVLPWADAEETTVCLHDTPARKDELGTGAAPLRGAKPRSREDFTLHPAEGLPFERLGHYRILERIGSGGMGDVYLGHDESLDRQVAVKVLPPELARDDEFVQRFHAEASAAAKVVHPNIVPVYFIGEDAGYHYFAMQFVEGTSLAQQLVCRLRIPVDETLNIVSQCLAGLEAAHAQGLIHRDVKPGNVLLERHSGRVMLADFGLVHRMGKNSQATATGAVVGTVDYIAPEQARGHAVDGRADLYALGLLMYRLLAGRLPFEAESPSGMFFKHACEEPFPFHQAAPDVPRPLADIVTCMMSKHPEDRYQSCAEVKADLEAFREGRPVAASLGEHAEPATGILPTFEQAGGSERPIGPAESTHERFWRRIGSWLTRTPHARGPRLVRELQGTMRRVKKEVAEYERRRDRFAELLDEACDAVTDLSTQIETNGAASADPAHMTDSAASAADKQTALASNGARRESADMQKSQKEEQERRIEEIEEQMTGVEATLARLLGQYETLETRLRIAEAAEVPTGGPLQTMRRQWVPLAVIVGGVILAGSLYTLWTELNPSPNNTTPEPPFAERFPYQGIEFMPLEKVEATFDSSNASKWAVQDGHVKVSMGGAENPTMAKDQFQASAAAFGYKVKSEWHHFIRIDVDGREYFYSRGHSLNTSTQIGDGKGGERRDQTVPPSDANVWCSLAVVLKDDAVGFYYKDRLVWWSKVEPAPEGQNGKHVIRVGFASHNIDIRTKDFFLSHD